MIPKDQISAFADARCALGVKLLGASTSGALKQYK